MKSPKFGVMALGWGAALLSTLPLLADGPWASLIPFRRVEADPQKSYVLTEEHGPWLILAANFDGSDAEQRARDLVLELRSRNKLPAYVHKLVYDFSQPFQGNRLTPRGDGFAKMRYYHDSKYDGVAVLVGNFRSVEESDLQKTLERVKQLRPDCLAKSPSTGGNESLASLREIKRRLGAGSGKNKGPMGSAFV